MDPSDSRKRKRHQPQYRGPPAEFLAHVPNMPSINDSSTSPEIHEELDGETITLMPPARKRRKETFFLDPVTGKPILPTPESEGQSPLAIPDSHASNSEHIIEQGRGSLYATEVLPVPNRNLKLRPLSNQPDLQNTPARELGIDSELSSVPCESIEGVKLESVNRHQEESRPTPPIPPPPTMNKTHTMPIRQHEAIEPELVRQCLILFGTALCTRLCEISCTSNIWLLGMYELS